MNIYYAHPVTLYGTKQEERDIKTLKDLGYTVINPNDPVRAKGYEEQGMEYFKSVVQDECDGLAFRAFHDGLIGAGIAKEIRWARDVKHPVIELPSGITRRRLSIKQTMEILRHCGHR